MQVDVGLAADDGHGLGPALPIGTSSAPSAGHRSASAAGRVRLTTMRRRAGAGGTGTGASLR
jgi:hypothetical protein